MVWQCPAVRMISPARERNSRPGRALKSHPSARPATNSKMTGSPSPKTTTSAPSAMRSSGKSVAWMPPARIRASGSSFFSLRICFRGHGVIRRDDREAGDVGLEILDQLQQPIVRQTFDVLVEDADFMPVLLEERAQETDAQRVFAVHLLGLYDRGRDE